MNPPLAAKVHDRSCPHWRGETGRPCTCPPGHPHWIGIDRDGDVIFGKDRVLRMLKRAERT